MRCANNNMEKIKELREKTGAGMVECKKALDEANGDMEAAIEILRKKSGAKAAKKADRITSEGVVVVAKSADGKKVAVAKVMCETDFVARNDDFKKFALEVATAGLSGSIEEAFEAQKNEIVAKVGENVTFGGGEVVEGAFITSYIHSNDKVASVVVFNKEAEAGLASDIAMHVVAMSPAYLLPEEVPTEELDKEKEIYREQLRAEGKNDEMIEKILGGKVAKYYEDVCLVKQIFIKDDKKKVEEIVSAADKDLKIEKFFRFSL